MRPVRRPRLALVAALAVSGTTTVTPRAGAAEPTASELQAARALFAAAERDEDARRWEAALEKLRKVASVKMTSGVRYHVALCEENLGHLLPALTEYTAAEALATRERNTEVLESVRAPLAALRERLPELTVRPPVDAPVAEIALDGHVLAAGVMGVPMPVDPGAHTVTARAPGRVDFARTVMLAERQRAWVDVTLPHVPPPPPAPVAAVEASAPRADDVPRPAEPGGAPSRAGAIAATAGAATLVGAGVAFFVVAGDKQASVYAFCQSQAGACGDELRTPTRTFDALALGSWIGGGVLGALAVVLWTRRAPAQAALVPLPGGAALRGTF